MKKLRAIIFISLTLTFLFVSCSKNSANQKEDFFKEFQTLVTKAENNFSEDRIPELQDEYSKFFEKYNKITSSSKWTDEDTEKMESLIKRFSLATTPMTTDFSSTGDDYEVINDDLGLDDELIFGSTFNFDENGELIPTKPSSSTDDLGLSGLSMPNLDFINE